MPFMNWATHVLQGGCQWDAIAQAGAKPQKSSQFELFSATREHEVGIASNRGTPRHGEYVIKPSTHRPSRQENGPGPDWLGYLG